MTPFNCNKEYLVGINMAKVLWYRNTINGGILR